MISPFEMEKIQLDLDVTRLRTEVENLVKVNAGIPSVPSILSWPLLSRDGKTDRVFDGRLPCLNGPMDRNPSAAELESFGVQRKSQDASIPTAYCRGYLREVLQHLDDLGLWPRGARINGLKPRDSTSLHKDTVIDQYAISLHIPVITSRDCDCIIGQGRYSLEADGSIYLCNINLPHQFFNRGDSIRYHIIMASWDTRGLSKHFQYKDSTLPLGPSINWKASEYRKAGT